MWFFLVICYLSGLVGARPFFVLEHFPFLEDTATPASLEPGGFSAFGTAIFNSLVAVLVIRRLQMPIGPVFDSMVLGLCALVAVGRLGCFFGGCCFGTPTDVPWGVAFSSSHFATIRWGFGTLLHPTQLYEAFLMGALAFAFAKLPKKMKFDGELFLWWFLAYAAMRFLNGFFRGDALVEFGNLNLAQWISCATGFGALIGIGWVRKRRVSPGGRWAAPQGPGQSNSPAAEITASTARPEREVKMPQDVVSMPS